MIVYLTKIKFYIIIIMYFFANVKYFGQNGIKFIKLSQRSDGRLDKTGMR